jgi:hypothetical protein
MAGCKQRPSGLTIVLQELKMRECLQCKLHDSAITVRDSYKKVKEQQRTVIGKDLPGANSQTQTLASSL